MLFAPMLRQTDDQAGSGLASRRARRGPWRWTLVPGRSPRWRTLLDPGRRAAMRARLEELRPGNGAAEAAGWLEELALR